MSNLLQKSSFNIDAAEGLITSSIYAPSVHCSYYGCFQFLKHTLKNFKNISYETIESESKDDPRGPHGYVIENCLNEIRKIADFNTFKDIKRDIKDLKTFRITSDYLNVEITIDQSEKSLNLSKNLIKEIKKILK